MGGVVDCRQSQRFTHPGVPGSRGAAPRIAMAWSRESRVRQLGVTMDDRVPMVTQERAYTSPIWYTS